jgi:3-isopropylmalate dehydrogenase
MQKKIAVLEGDGIGPEIMKEALKVLDAVAKKYNHNFRITSLPYGADSYFKTKSCFPEKTKKTCLESDAVLKGPVGLDLKGMAELQKNRVHLENETIIPLRKLLDSYIGFRPAILPKAFAEFSPLKPEVIGEGINILIMREMVGGIYFGNKTEWTETDMKYASDDCTYTKTKIERFAKAVFEEATKKKCKVTNVHKANVLATSRLWNEVFLEVGKNYPNIVVEQMLVDNVAFQLMINPTRFNGIMALENMQGDIISDQAGGILGSLGLMPSACFNPEKGLGYYEPSHGSAPDIAGKNIANPYSMIGCVAFMLDKSFGLEKESNVVWDALIKVFSDGYRTKELANKTTTPKKILSTTEFGDKVVENINKAKK